MESHYMEWPSWFSRALEMYRGLAGVFRGLSHVYSCGMGGSGAASDYLAELLWYTGSSVRLTVVKDLAPREKPSSEYGLVLSSYSGNTVETLACGERLAKQASSILAVTSGGRLLELARSRGWSIAEVPQGLLPRVSFPWMLGALISSFSEELNLNLEALSSRTSRIDVAEARSKAGVVAEFLYDHRIATIASCGPTTPLAVRLKNELAENSKMPSRLEVYPESSHNDIVALETARGLYGGVFLTPSSGECMAVMRAASQIYAEYGVPYLELVVGVDGGVEDLAIEYLYWTIVAGLSSVELARRRGLDPASTRPIERYKRIVSI
ncbi:MAG: bifunctional phosphoglucose/phosphomannose isomerase [Aeropyrum sp.]|nr:bifunctional phosphoglucose/phosphomannose isomerase [Aeropyrum sp.]MCE4615790.1 bifunctional phosphoglucose/phosphomannose isomerase [Aeropyrum sp.]